MTRRFHFFRGPNVGLARKLRRGATAVEMALITPVFFLLLMGMIEIALMLTAQQLLENATFNTSRLAKTGYSAAGETQGQTVSALLNGELQSFGTLIDVTKVTLSSVAYADFQQIGGTGTSGMGTQDQIVVIPFHTLGNYSRHAERHYRHAGHGHAQFTHRGAQ